MSQAFGAARIQTKPPERGVFPLDHEAECKPMMKEYLSCLREKKGDNFECKPLSKNYLACRMERGLMAKDDFENLGFGDKPYRRVEVVEGEKEKSGFVAGINVRGSNKFAW